MRERLLLLITLAAMLSGCSTKGHAAKQESDQTLAFRKPTAAEVFNLRTKCAELAQRKVDEYIIGSALAKHQISHYNPQTNRCYVEIDVSMADLNKFQEHYSRSLYDGQTGEMLASVSTIKDEKTSYLKDGNCSKNCYQVAEEFIESTIADDRKQ